MANKKLLVSDNNGKYKEVSASVDNDILSASVSTLTASFINTAVSGIMHVYNGQYIPFWTTSSIIDYYRDGDNNPITPPNLSGCLFQLRTDEAAGAYKGIGPHRIDSASFSGDIVGTLSSSFPIRVVAVENVNSGVLDSRYGGTSTSSFDTNSLITLSGSGLKPSGGSNGQVIAVNSSGQWSYQDSSYTNFTALTESVVYLYTSSAETTTTIYSGVNAWKKPEGCRFIRVICQGGGGGGGCSAGTLITDASGGGGAAGGYSDITLNSFSITSSINIIIGKGGTGGSNPNINAESGVSSSFGEFLYANGGSGGNSAGANSNNAPSSSGGTGYIYSGSNGGAENLPGSSTVKFTATGGGGGGLGANNTAAPSGGDNGAVLGATGGLNSTAQLISGGDGSSSNVGYYFRSKKYFLNGTDSANLVNSDLPALCASGGGGGGKYGPSTVNASYRGGDGGSGKFGAGGGGGGSAKAGANRTGYGGNGGAGYVLIICT